MSAPAASQQSTLRQRVFAYMMANNRAADTPDFITRRRNLLGGLSGQVIELGPGAGINLGYYTGGVRWLGIEPNPAMHPYLREAARRAGLAIKLHAGDPAHFPVEDGTVDAVVCTHVMCSVPDLEVLLVEVRRVLKPGGRFVFLEHVAAPADTPLRRWQAWIRPLWSFFGGGCQPNRETWTALQAAGFSSLDLEFFKTDFLIIGPHIAGVAVK